MVTMILPTLLSGLNAIIINKNHLNILDNRFKSIWRRIFGLFENSTILILILITGTPLPSTVYFMNVLALFWNIWKVKSPTRQICYNILKDRPPGYYWIDQVNDICGNNDIPPPLFLLENGTPSKNAWKYFLPLNIHT